jgi:hypothetical protein
LRAVVNHTRIEGRDGQRFGLSPFLVFALAPFLISACYLLLLLSVCGLLQLLVFIGLSSLALPIGGIGMVVALPLAFLMAVRSGVSNRLI